MVYRKTTQQYFNTALANNYIGGCYIVLSVVVYTQLLTRDTNKFTTANEPKKIS